MEMDRKPVAARRWYHWHEPGTTKEEKWLIFKLDLNILTYLCLVRLLAHKQPKPLAAANKTTLDADIQTFFVKYLDQTNVTNAFAAGMKNDLNMS
ncbi:putative transporter SEO1 [Beauveria bassiana]|uniref:Putative transporter SEO1 n=1 Tax=Beauveria bassiana TaxID=176275 RepID=A0A2N6NRF2_BEABA|nr:putative transporter SEO1 [Beauveria bassiana]